MAPLTPPPVLDYLSRLRREPHPRLAVIAEEGTAEGRVSVMVGDATRLLHKVAGPFDLIFQDSDKTLYQTMHHRLVELLRPGVLVADNILWNGEVIPGYVTDKTHSDFSTAAIAGFSRHLADDPRLYTSFLPVGDGVSVSVKRAS